LKKSSTVWIVVYDRAKRAGSEKKKKETSFMPQVKPINTPRRKKRKKNEGILAHPCGMNPGPVLFGKRGRVTVNGNPI
jgi:hypothetical protein